MIDNLINSVFGVLSCLDTIGNLDETKLLDCASVLEDIAGDERSAQIVVEPDALFAVAGKRTATLASDFCYLPESTQRDLGAILDEIRHSLSAKSIGRVVTRPVYNSMDD